MTLTSLHHHDRARVRGPSRARLALLVFAGVEVAAFVLFLVYGHSQWFFLDDFDFLADRELRDIDDLLRPHNEHWSTLPIIVYRVLWQGFGLRTYVPYQLVAIVLHLTVAALLRVVMRRAGVDPWIATLAASLFALFGAASQNIVWAFQMAWGAALVFGFTHLLLADHDGPVDRRDWLGLLAGAAGLMCAGVGVTMTIVVGVAMLVRRGWQIALLHTLPLGLAFCVWWVAYARDEYDAANLSVGVVTRFVVTGFAATFGALGQVPGVGVALGVLLVVGLVFAWAPLDRDEFRRQAAAPGALLLGAIVFLVISGTGRAGAFGPDFARSGRYLHVVGALSLPAVAIAADAAVRRWKVLWPVVVAVLVIGVPGNLGDLANRERGSAQFELGTPSLVLALPRVARADEVPRNVHPLRLQAPEVTIGWLRDGVESGRIPRPDRIDAPTAGAASLYLALEQSARPERREGCEELRRPVTRRLAKGESVQIGGFGSVRVTELDSGRVRGTVRFNPANGRTLTALTGPLDLRFALAAVTTPALICD